MMAFELMEETRSQKSFFKPHNTVQNSAEKTALDRSTSITFKICIAGHANIETVGGDNFFISNTTDRHSLLHD